MKKFTIKDMMLYHNPCRACGNNTNFSFCVISCVQDSPSVRDWKIRPELNDSYLKIPLSIRYKYRLDLHINLLTNEFIVHSKKSLYDFLKNHQIYAQAVCGKCGSYINTDFLFTENDKFIKPVGLYVEVFYFKNEGCDLIVKNNYEGGATTITFNKSNGHKTLNVPLIPMYKFKTNEALFQKIKMMLTFS